MLALRQIGEESVKIGRLGLKRIGANNTALNSVKIALKKSDKVENIGP